MLTRNRFILLIVLILYQSTAWSTDRIIINDSIVDKNFVYNVVCRKLSNEELSIIINVKCHKECSSDDLNEFYKQNIFNNKLISLENSDSKVIIPNDVIAENYIDFIRFIYSFSERNITKIKKININNNELKISL